MKLQQPKKQILLTIIFIISTLFTVACQNASNELNDSSSVSRATLTPNQIIKIGDISDDPAGVIEKFQPMADYLASHLGEFGIQAGQVVVAPDLPAMINFLETGRVDIYFDSPYPALTVYEEANAQPLLRRWKDGVSEYHTIIAVRQDSGITDLDGLLGHIVAFDDPQSTSGYLLPKSFLVNSGYAVNEKSTVTSFTEADEIGYVFAGGEENVIAWILDGRTIGAMIPSGDFAELDDDIKAQLTILAETPNVPRHITIARPNLNEALQNEITDLLRNMNQTAEGQQILELFENTSQFDELPGGAEETIRTLQALFAPVRE